MEISELSNDSIDHIRPSQALESYFWTIFTSQNCEGWKWGKTLVSIICINKLLCTIIHLNSFQQLE